MVILLMCGCICFVMEIVFWKYAARCARQQQQQPPLDEEMETVQFRMNLVVKINSEHASVIKEKYDEFIHLLAMYTDSGDI